MTSVSATPMALEEPGAEAGEATPLTPDVLRPGLSFPPAGQGWFQVATRKADNRAAAVRAEHLGMYPFWTPNPSGLTWCIVIDIDESDALMRVWQPEPDLPLPHWVIENEVNGHCQIGFVIDPITHTADSPYRFEALLVAATRSLAKLYGGDTHFSGARCRNPFYVGARAWLGDWPPYKVSAIREVMQTHELWDATPVHVGPSRSSESAGLPDVPRGVATEGDRNCAVFDACRLAAYRGEDHVAAAHAVVTVPPLPAAEVRAIIRSVESYMGRPDADRRKGGAADSSALMDAHKRRQSARGKRGGSRKTAAQAAGLAQGPAASAVSRSATSILRARQILDLHEEGRTRAQIQAELKVSEATVKRAIRSARATRENPSGGGVISGASVVGTPVPALGPLTADTPAPPPEPPERGHPSHPTPTRDDRPTPSETSERTEHDEPVHRPEPAARPVDRRGRARAEAAAPEAEAPAVACDPGAGRAGSAAARRDPASGSGSDAQRGTDDGRNRRGDGRER